MMYVTFQHPAVPSVGVEIPSEMCGHSVKGEVCAFVLLTGRVVDKEMLCHVLHESIIAQSSLELPVSDSGCYYRSFLRLMDNKNLVGTDLVLS